MTTESAFLRKLLVALSRVATVFRQNVGSAWMGRAAKSSGRVTLSDPRFVKFGLCAGSSDVIGWTQIKITEAHVGKTIAVFTAVEAKGEKTRITDEQKRFLSRVAADGGIAILARAPGGDTMAAGVLRDAQAGRDVFGRVWGLGGTGAEAEN